MVYSNWKKKKEKKVYKNVEVCVIRVEIYIVLLVSI